jgi:hypothetical protein
MSSASGILGGFSFSSIAKFAKSAISTAKDILKTTAGSFVKSGFEAAKQTLHDEIGKLLNIKSPTSENIGAPGAPPATGGAGSVSASSALGSVTSGNTNVRDMIKNAFGEEVAKHYDTASLDQKKDLEMQAIMNRTSRMNQLMTNILQTMHEMSKAIIQNTRA